MSSQEEHNEYSLLAGRYVLGIIQGKARTKFISLSKDDKKMQQYIRQWEQYFYQFDQNINPITPPKATLSKIMKRINGKSNKSLSFWEKLRFWQALSASFIMVALLLSLVLINPFDSAPNIEYTSIIQDKQHRPLWLINAFPEQQTMTIKTLNSPQIIGDQKDFELWLLPKTGVKLDPISMGLLPKHGTKQMPLSKQLQGLSNTNKIAVSLEPLGGSLTKLPSGEVLFVANFIKITSL